MNLLKWKLPAFLAMVILAFGMNLSANNLEYDNDYASPLVEAECKCIKAPCRCPGSNLNANLLKFMQKAKAKFENCLEEASREECKEKLRDALHGR